MTATKKETKAASKDKTKKTSEKASEIASEKAMQATYKAAAKTNPKTAVKPASKTVSKPASKTVSKPASKAAAKPASKAAAKPASKAAAKPASKAAAKPASKAAAKTASKAVAKPASKAAAKPASKTAAKPASKAAAKPASKAAAKPASKAAAKPASKAAAKPASKAAAKPASKAAAKPASKAAAKPVSKSSQSSSPAAAVPFRKSAGNPDTKTPRQETTEMPIVKRLTKPVLLSKLPRFPISKKPDNRANFNAVWEILQQIYPKPEVELDFETPFEILAATILSAQCTDRQVNTVTKVLFKKYRTIEDYARADPAEFGKDIYSTGFFNSKTKHIIGCANAILKDFGGTVPGTMEELTKLPGVGRKTANIVLSRSFGINDGIAVDTHVKRLSNKIGFTEHEEPEKIEQDLMKLAKREDYDNLSLTLIFHGRRVCDAKKPRCDVCAIWDMCPSAFI